MDKGYCYSGEDVAVQVGVVELGNVTQHHQIAVQVDDLLVLGKHGGDEEAVVGHHREVVDVLEAGLDVLDLLGNVHKVNGKALPFIALDQVDILLPDARVEDDDAVAVVLRGVADEGGDGHVQKGDVIVVGGEKDRDLPVGDAVKINHAVVPHAFIFRG